jgi:ATP-dependent 26S proteasome regulatory subunit
MQVTKLSAIQQLDVMIRARYPVVWIVTQEESRVENLVLGLLKSSPKHTHKEVLTWTISKGLRFVSQPDEQFGPDDPIAALQFVGDYGRDEGPAGKPAVFVLKDLHPYFEDPRVTRAFKDVLADIATTQKTVIVISPVLAVPDDCKRKVAVIEWSLPTVDELGDLLDDFIVNLPAGISTLNGNRETVAKALQGLTEFQAQSVLATAVVATGRLDGDAVEFIIQEKSRLIKESGLLEFFQPDESMAKIGGLDLLRGYLTKRRKSFSDQARAYGVQAPKGMLMVGVPGCGKSLASKTLSSLWQLPLIRLDVGALMGSLVGQSESNLRSALKVAESASPCILWLDEIEKGLSGVKSSGSSDGGTTARVFGALLTWMQEKTAPVYIVATSNDIESLPPELLRAGRFDDIFFVDLPTIVERSEIWSIHIAKTGRDPEGFDIASLAEASASYTGAEIEAAVGEALYVGFDEDREITTDDLLVAIQGRVPLTSTMREQIDGLRKWAASRAKPASSPVATGTASDTSRAASLDI